MGVSLGSRRAERFPNLGERPCTGAAFVGPTGPATVVDDFTALGDVVNTTARLASAAAAGELLVSVAAAEAGGSVPSDAERRTLEVRGREATVDVVVLRPAEGRAPVQV